MRIEALTAVQRRRRREATAAKKKRRIVSSLAAGPECRGTWFSGWRANASEVPLANKFPEYYRRRNALATGRLRQAVEVEWGRRWDIDYCLFAIRRMSPFPL